MIELVVTFRSQGVRWPLRVGDPIEVYKGVEHVATLDGGFVIYAVQQYLDALALASERIAAAELATRRNQLPPAPEGIKHGPAITPGMKERLRGRRRTRREEPKEPTP
jgi:hypothetical protein